MKFAPSNHVEGRSDGSYRTAPSIEVAVKEYCTVVILNGTEGLFQAEQKLRGFFF